MPFTTWRRSAGATALVVLASGVVSVAAPAQAAPGDRLRRAVTVPGIVAHQARLQRIANHSRVDGVPTRATGTRGHARSVRYVVRTMRQAGFKVRTQPFDATIFRELSPGAFQRVSPSPTTFPELDGDAGVWAAMDFSGSGDRTAAAQVVDFAEPTATANVSTSGCEAADFNAQTAGTIVVMQRGTCPFADKVLNAQAAGAVGAVILNEGTLGDPARNETLTGTLGEAAVTIPVVGTDYATGRALVDQAAAGPLTLRVRVDASVRTVRTRNVIADSRRGRVGRTVVVGAHLDSVYQGPGINDNGSGSALMLETAQQMKRLGLRPRNRVRFIFFSGEEQGLLGSDHYVAGLTPRQVRRTAVMLNFDMIASGNFARLVYDGDGSDFGVAGPGGSGTVERVFSRWYRSHGLAFETTPFDGRSDYNAFTLAGIPAGGLFSGAEDVKTAAQVALYGGTTGEAFDPCYHQRCDTLAHISRTGLRQHKNAAVHTIWRFAQRRAPVRTARTVAAPPRAVTQGHLPTR